MIPLICLYHIPVTAPPALCFDTNIYTPCKVYYYFTIYEYIHIKLAMPRIARGSIPYEGIELLLFYIAIDLGSVKWESNLLSSGYEPKMIH